MMQSDNLSVHALYKSFKQGNTTIPVLKEVTASFRQGSTYAIMGVSGSGKSTLIQLLAGLDLPTRGQIFFNNKDLALFSEVQREAFLNKKIGLVFQQAHLIRELSIEENVMIPGIIAGMSWQEGRKRAHELLEAVGIADKALHKPGSLSGGQQQRLILARALFNRPTFLLADEPTGGLDLETGKAIITLLLRLQKEYHMGIIVSTHDTQVADHMEETCILHNGKLKRS